nr:alpha-amylase family glycosyl hydrolase [Melioribacteraceae bacterium]
MKSFIKLSITLLFLTINLFAQVIVSNPEFATENDSIVITFDATQGGQGLMEETGDVFAHTGVNTNIDDWQHVIESWGNNSTQPKLTRIGTDLYELVIGYPRNFYSMANPSEIINEIAFVFRSADGSKQTDDLFLTLYQGGLNVSIINPSERNLLILINDEIDVVVKSSDSDSLFLYLDDSLLTSTTTDSIGYTITVTSEADRKIIARATDLDGNSVYDTVSYSVRGEVIIENLPDGIVDGINYIDNSTVTLAFFAPKKDFIYVIGDFNDWAPKSEYMMKITPDHSTFWITLTGLSPNVEYAFQYLVDGTLALADPYTEKILESEDDQIDNVTYPSLKDYPKGKTDGSVSIIEINKEMYQWTATEYQRPDRQKAVIYELLIRDFLHSHNYQTLIDTLDYLENLGINAIELMPVNEFEYNSSWGYNPSFYFAPDKYYGTENALKQFIDEAHKRNIAVLMDVVYNHTFGRSPFVRLYS